mgnify:CR=1 FL=1
MIALTIFLCDRVTSGFINPWFSRLRPSQEPSILDQIDIVNGSRSGKFGFVSSHAANSFGIFMFLALLIKSRSLNLTLFIWAAFTSFSRVYLGVHYPTDILVGALLGVLFAFIVYRLYRKIDGNPTEYRHDEPWWITVVFLLTIITILIISIFYENFI